LKDNPPISCSRIRIQGVREPMTLDGILAKELYHSLLLQLIVDNFLISQSSLRGRWPIWWMSQLSMTSTEVEKMQNVVFMHNPWCWLTFGSNCIMAILYTGAIMETLLAYTQPTIIRNYQKSLKLERGMEDAEAAATRQRSVFQSPPQIWW
jgi:hypothetical protein